MKAQVRQEVVDVEVPGIGDRLDPDDYRANRRSFPGTSPAPWRLSGGPTADARREQRSYGRQR